MISFAVAPAWLGALCIFTAKPAPVLAIFENHALSHLGAPDGEAVCLHSDIVSLLQFPVKGTPISRIESSIGHGNPADSHRIASANSRLDPYRHDRIIDNGVAHAITEVAIVIGALIACSIALMAIWTFCRAEPGETRFPPPKQNNRRPQSITGSFADSVGGISDPPQSSDFDAQRKVPEVTSQKNIKGALLDKLETASSSSTASSEKEDDPSCGTILWSFIVFGPLVWFATLAFSAAFLLIQICALPFRICAGRPLTFVLNLFGPVMSCLTFVFVTTNHGESCYGKLCENFQDYEEFLQTCSASRRKNIKRNSNAAKKEFESLGIQESYFHAGSWRITSEICSVIWHQCTRHNERAHGHADIMNCSQPVSPRVMFFGEMLLLLAFPCDIQLFRSQDNQLVSLNTRVHIGNVYFNPNYATLEDYSQIGIYAYANMKIMQEAIRLRASVVNFMPSMRSAKRALGLRSLRLASLIGASVSCSRAPRPPNSGRKTAEAKSTVPKGGKRSQRKLAAKEQASDVNIGRRDPDPDL